MATISGFGLLLSNGTFMLGNYVKRDGKWSRLWRLSLLSDTQQWARHGRFSLGISKPARRKHCYHFWNNTQRPGHPHLPPHRAMFDLR